METRVITSKVAGVTYDGRQDIIATLCGDEPVQVRPPEPDNPHDPNALTIWAATAEGPKHVGYVPREAAEILAPKIDGESVIGRIVEITGGTSRYPTRGLLVEFEIPAE